MQGGSGVASVAPADDAPAAKKLRLPPCANGGVPSLERVRSLPKVELHAHLSGSITQAKLSELLKRRGLGETFKPFNARQELARHELTEEQFMAHVWDYFDKVNKVVTSLDVLKESALHVFDSFASENCVYLELRTTVKTYSVPAEREGEAPAQTQKLDYLTAVKRAADEFQSYAKERYGFVMEIKVLLSVDRGKVTCKEDALRQIDDIIAMSKAYPELVVGVDVCGNPAKPTVIPHVIPAMLERREAFAELPITFHTAEVADDNECELILDNMEALNIRRLGHVCYMSEPHRRRVLEGRVRREGVTVGVEFCPTSNLVTRGLPGLGDHHFVDWWKQSDKVLLSINTDDVGLFSCDLTSEVHDMASAFGLSWEDLLELQRQALRSSFHPDKQRLLETLEQLAKR